MKIRPSFFENGNEIDCLGHFQGSKRMSIRRPIPDRYEVYTFDFHSKKEEVLCFGRLDECLAYTNRITGYNDFVEIE